jgi:hypothetical protein
VPSNALYETARNKFKNALSQTSPRNALVDAARGALMGVSTDVLGYPVDLATMAMRPFGYNVEKPVGGSDWLADKLTTPTNSLAENAGRFATGMLTPGPQEMLRLAGIGRNPMMNELTVYHGSPHRINNVDEANPMGRFDLSKVGTGEGAQAYGHGVYLAESPDVARQYAGSLSAARATQPVGNVDLTQLYQSMPNDVPDNLLAARRDFRELQGMGELSAADRRDYLQAVQNNIVGGKGGNFYTVDLPDEHIAKMLDWDAPLSEQPESVRKAIADRVADVDPDGMDLGGGRVLRNGSIEGGRRFPDKPYPWVLQAGDSVFGLSEKDVRRMVGESVETLTGEQAYARLSANMGSQAKATEFLRSVGLPGIKYFDGGSRGAGQGTRNFVIFDGDTAKILKRE